MTNQNLKVLTAKGLRYLLATTTDPATIQLVKAELLRRGLRIPPKVDHQRNRERERDGYEKD